MKFEVTKQWKELPYKMVTITAPLSATFRLEGSLISPTTDGIAVRGTKIEKVTDSKLWIKLDSNETAETITVDVVNFI